MPVEAHRVAHAMGNHCESCAVELQTGNRRITWVSTLADITWRTYGHVEHAIRSQTDELPAMMRITGITVVDHDGLWRIGQTRLNVVVAQDAVHLGYVQGPIMEGDAVRHV